MRVCCPGISNGSDHSPMKRNLAALLLTLAIGVFRAEWVDAARQLPTTVAEFVSANFEVRKTIIVQIIEHKSNLPSPEIANIIGAALSDADPVFRESALAAVVSRAAAPQIVSNDATRSNWRRDQSEIQRLRVQVTDALGD